MWRPQRLGCFLVFALLEQEILSPRAEPLSPLPLHSGRSPPLSEVKGQSLAWLVGAAEISPLTDSPDPFVQSSKGL